VLLNNCPKLTHLSLTGVQAFLRDDLLTFCREAPPEFNDHQRDVFCVFSGGGVSRLRDHLNEEKAHALAGEVSTPSENSDDLGLDDYTGDPDSDGSNTPVINIDVHGSHPVGATPIARPAGPASGPGMLFANLPHNQTHWQLNTAAGPSHLSQSAPATTGPVIWPSNVSGQSVYQQPLHGAGGSAQHVTGMMGATILDDLEEGDEAFGEDSEIMGD